MRLMSVLWNWNNGVWEDKYICEYRGYVEWLFHQRIEIDKFKLREIVYTYVHQF